MTYEYASAKIEKLYNEALERFDFTEKQIQLAKHWTDRHVWRDHLDEIVNEYRAGADLVIEIYIEIGPDDGHDWRELSEKRFELENDLRDKIK